MPTGLAYRPPSVSTVSISCKALHPLQHPHPNQTIKLFFNLPRQRPARHQKPQFHVDDEGMFGQVRTRQEQPSVSPCQILPSYRLCYITKVLPYCLWVIQITGLHHNHRPIIQFNRLTNNVVFLGHVRVAM